MVGYFGNDFFFKSQKNVLKPADDIWRFEKEVEKDE